MSYFIIKAAPWLLLLPGGWPGVLLCHLAPTKRVTHQQSVLFTLGREEPRKSGQFQELPEPVLSCLPSVQRRFCEDWNAPVFQF